MHWLNTRRERDEKGASLVEYLLLVALIATVVIAATTTLSPDPKVDDFNKASDYVTKELGMTVLDHDLGEGALLARFDDGNCQVAIVVGYSVEGNQVEVVTETRSRRLSSEQDAHEVTDAVCAVYTAYQ